MELLSKIVTSFQLLAIFEKSCYMHIYYRFLIKPAIHMQLLGLIEI